MGLIAVRRTEKLNSSFRQKTHYKEIKVEEGRVKRYFFNVLWSASDTEEMDGMPVLFDLKEVPQLAAYG